MGKAARRRSRGSTWLSITALCSPRVLASVCVCQGEAETHDQRRDRGEVTSGTWKGIGRVLRGEEDGIRGEGGGEMKIITRKSEDKLSV